jgi:hypothetical protein
MNTNISDRLLHTYMSKDEIQRRIYTFVPPRSRTFHFTHFHFFPFLLMGRRRNTPGTQCKSARRNWIKRATHVLPVQNTRRKHPPRRKVRVVTHGAISSPQTGFQLRYRRSRRRSSSPSPFLWVGTTRSRALGLSLCVLSILITYVD